MKKGTTVELPPEAVEVTNSAEPGKDGKLTCRIYDMEQGSDLWHDTRMRLFTASEVGISLIEEPKCRLTVDELKDVLTGLRIGFTSKDKKPDLERKLPDARPYLSLTATTIEARTKLIRKKMELHTTEGKLLAAEENRKLAYNFDIKRGNELEPEARALYAQLTGNDVTQVGLCVHESSQFDHNGNPISGFGCSPDGLIQDGEVWKKGLELKCVRPATLLSWLEDDCLPEEHVAQVLMSMAVTGLSEWDFFGYAREVPPMLVTVKWNPSVGRFVTELKKLHSDFQSYWNRVAKMTYKHISV